MNVIYHHRTQGKGVEGVHIQGVVNGLNQLNCHVDIVSPAGVSVDESFSVKHKSHVGNALKVLSKNLPEFLFECLECLYNFSAIRKLNKQLATKKYDLIFERYAFLTWAGLYCAKKAGIPFIIEVNYTSYVPLVRKRSKLLRWLQLAIEHKLYSRADGIIVVSSFLKNQLVELGIPKNKIRLLTNAADPNSIKPIEPDSDLFKKYELENKNVLGFVGGFYPWHGLDFLLKALEIIVQERQDIVMLLIGDGPERPALERTIINRKLTDFVKFVGPVRHDTLQKYLSLFDLAILPDTNNYGSPMKIFEYMAMGLPIVAPRYGPVEDAISDWEEGVLFEPLNKADFASAVLELLSKDNAIQAMGKKAREKIIDKHNWVNNSTEILSLLKESHIEIKN